MAKQMTPQQASRFGTSAVEAVMGAKPLLSAEAMQAVLGDSKTSTCLVEIVRLGSAEALRRLQVEAQAPVPVSPYTHGIINESILDYPPGWQMLDWKTQLDVLQDVFPYLDATGLREMAEGYAVQDIWSLPLGRPGYNKCYPLWDGLMVFALPGRVAAKRWDLDLWADIARGSEDNGLWGRLCREVLFPQFTLPSDNPKYANFSDESFFITESDRFRPEASVAQWLQDLEARTEGDFSCRPCNLGRRFAGYSVKASRWEAENLLGGLAAPTWLEAQYLLADPNCLADGFLRWDAGGDQLRFGYGEPHLFDHACCFERDESDLIFDARNDWDPHHYSGTVLVSL